MLDDAVLAELESSVQDALERGDVGNLRLLGEGEISLVLACGDDPMWACKRLPPFATAAAADRYAATIGRYVDILRSRGVAVLETTVRRIRGADGEVVLYCVQPVLRAEELAVAVVRNGDPDVVAWVLGSIVDTVLGVVDSQVGLDAQLSNWAIVDGVLVQLDITTPLLRHDDGVAELDTDVFVASLPWVLRRAVQRWVVPGIVARYHDPRTVVLDVAANLLKEGLGACVPVVLEAATDRVAPPLSLAEARRDRRNDAVVWATLQFVRRVDRTWQRRVRRRPYPFLLPTHRHR